MLALKCWLRRVTKRDTWRIKKCQSRSRTRNRGKQRLERPNPQKEKLMNETVKKTVDEKIVVLKQRHDALMTRKSALEAELGDVGKELAQIELEQADLTEFLGSET